MTLGQVRLTLTARRRVASVLRALIIAQLALAVCLVIFCYNATARALTMLLNIRRRTVLCLYSAIVLHAYCMKLHYTMGLRLITLLLKYSYWPRVNALCVAWMITGALIAINGSLIAVSIRNTVKTFSEDIRESLRVGITQYLTEPTWKRVFDSLQVELKCCGIERPSDWYELPWINMDFLNEDSDLVLKMAGSDARILPPSTPFSCCNSHTLGPCYHDPLQQANYKEVWEQKAELVAQSLHERGCLDAVREPLERMVYGLQCFSTIQCFIQVAVIVLAQTLRTSTRGAVLAGRPTGSAPGSMLLLTSPSKTSHRKNPRQEKRQDGGTQTDRSDGSGMSAESAAMLLLERGLASRRRLHSHDLGGTHSNNVSTNFFIY